MPYLDPIAGARREGGAPAVTGAPVAGTDEVQTIATTGTPTGGTFKLRFKNRITAAIAYNAAASAVASALNALETIGASGVVGGGGPLPTGVTITFSGAAVAKKAHPLISLAANNLTGGTTPTVTITETTPGVNATYRGARVGTIITRDNGVQYSNTGTPNAPVWTAIGSQT